MYDAKEWVRDLNEIWILFEKEKMLRKQKNDVADERWRRARERDERFEVFSIHLYSFL